MDTYQAAVTLVTRANTSVSTGLIEPNEAVLMLTAGYIMVINIDGSESPAALFLEGAMNRAGELAR